MRQLVHNLVQLKRQDVLLLGSIIIAVAGLMLSVGSDQAPVVAAVAVACPGPRSATHMPLPRQ
jgi:hypothetical protein